MPQALHIFLYVLLSVHESLQLSVFCLSKISNPISLCVFYSYQISEFSYCYSIKLLLFACKQVFEILLSISSLVFPASRATDRGGDLLHDEEVQVQADDPDPGETVQV